MEYQPNHQNQHNQGPYRSDISSDLQDDTNSGGSANWTESKFAPHQTNPKTERKFPAWMKKKRFWLNALLVVIIAFVMATPRNQENNIEAVQGDQVRAGDAFEPTLQAASELESPAAQSQELLRLQAPVPARLEFLATIGSQVKPGEVIARLSEPDIEQAHNLAGAALSDARDSLTETQTLNKATIRQASLAVTAAQVSLEQALASLETVKQLNTEKQNQAEAALEAVYSSAYNTIEQVINFWGTRSKNGFILKGTPSANKILLLVTEAEYFRVLEIFEEVDKATANSANIELVIEQTRTFNSRVARLLNFSLPMIFGTFTQATLETYEAQATAFQAQLNKALLNLQNAQSQLRTIRLNNQAAQQMAQSALEQARIDLDNSLSANESAQRQAEIRKLSSSSQVNLAQWQILMTKDRLRELTLYAPFAGVVIAHHAKVGDQVSVGQALLDLQQIEVVE